MTDVLGKFLALGLVLNSLVACSGSSDTKLVEQAPDEISQFNTKSCDYGVTEGGSPDFSALDARNISVTYFDKEYNQAYLNAVLATNVGATIDFVNKTGTTVYKSSAIVSRLCVQPLFQQALALPIDLQERWTEATESEGDKEGVLLGLYLPKSEASSQISLKDGAAIIVRENTNRWTLVHEFMHHLFMLRSTEQGYDQSIERDRLIAAAYEIQTISEDKSLSDSSKALMLVEPFARFGAGMDSKMVHFTLEEMTIEATLKKLQNEGSLQYAPADSNWYISTSADKALESYQLIEDIGYGLLELIDYSKTTERMSVREVLAKVSARKVSINSLKGAFPLEKKALRASILATGLKPEFHEGCSHQAETEKILAMVHKMKKTTSFLRK